MLPLDLGYVEGVTHDYKRHGTITLFAARDIASGQVLTQCKRRHRHQEFLQFLRQFDTNIPEEFDIHLIEERALGTYSGVGPLSPLSMGELLYGMRAMVSNEISFTWVDADFLAEHEVRAWMEMTAWVPPTGETAGFASFDNSRAVAAGLEYRPLAVSAKDTLDWWQTLPDERRASHAQVWHRRRNSKS